MTADQIQAALRAYTKRNDAETMANEPTALALSYQRVMRDFRAEEGLTLATVALVDGEGLLPADFGSVETINAAGVGELDYSTPREFANQRAVGTVANRYTVIYDRLLADGKYTALDVLHYSQPAQPTGSGSSWLSTHYPDVWLHAALSEQWRFVQDYAAASESQAYWQRLKADAEMASARRMAAGGRLTIRGR